jgi:beta-N-acetylhexosaminidase
MAVLHEKNNPGLCRPVLALARARESQQVGSTPPPLTKQDQEWVDETLNGLSLEEKVGQMLQVRCYADYASLESADYKSLRDELQKYHIGSVVLAAHINRQGLLRVSATDVARVTNQLQTDSKLPLLVAADLERGVASRLNDVPDFPWPMAFGAVGNATEVERFAAITARQARAVGIHWALAPVADVNSNPANPVINDRSAKTPSKWGLWSQPSSEAGTRTGCLSQLSTSPGMATHPLTPTARSRRSRAIWNTFRRWSFHRLEKLSNLASMRFY